MFAGTQLLIKAASFWSANSQTGAWAAGLLEYSVRPTPKRLDNTCLWNIYSTVPAPAGAGRTWRTGSSRGGRCRPWCASRGRGGTAPRRTGHTSLRRSWIDLNIYVFNSGRKSHHMTWQKKVKYPKIAYFSLKIVSFFFLPPALWQVLKNNCIK